MIKNDMPKTDVFISAITDRLGHFDNEVTALQNYTAPFNAGIIVGQLLVGPNDFVISGNDFSK